VKKAVLLVSDRWVFMQAEFTEACIEGLLSSRTDFSIPGMKGGVIALLDYLLSQNSAFTDYKLVIKQASWYEGAGCFPFGDPVDLSMDPEIRKKLQRKKQYMEDGGM